MPVAIDPPPAPSRASHVTAARSPKQSRRSALAWRVISDFRDVPAIDAQWRRLADRGAACLFATPDWIGAWHQQIAPQVRPRIITATDAAGQLVAVWPLGVRSLGRGVTACALLEPMGARLASGDRLDPLEAAGVAAGDVVEQARLAATGIDQIRWAEITATGAAASDITAGGRALTVRDRRRLPIIRLPNSFDEYLAQLSYNRRGQIRRKERVAIEGHGLTWTTTRESSTLEHELDALFDLHTQCWQGRGQSGNLRNPRLAAFLHAFCHKAQDNGWLRLHRLCDGSRTVAALLAFHYGRRAYFYQAGWDPSASNLSPGMLCLARAIRAAIDERMEVFDFLRGDESYKSHWAAEADETCTIVEPRTATGRMMLRATGVKETVKSGIRCIAGDAAWERLKSHVAFVSRLAGANDRAAAVRPWTRGPHRICHVLYRWSRSGMELQLAGQLRFLNDAGIRPTIASSVAPEPLVPDLPPGVDVRWYRRRWNDRFARWLARRVIQSDVSLIHAHGLWMLPGALSAARRAGGLPVIFSFHGFDDATSRLTGRRRRRWSAALQRCAAVVAVSRATRMQLATALDVDAARIRVIHNGVDTERFQPAADRADIRSRLGIDANRPLLLCVGSLLHVKGYDVLVDALSRCAVAPTSYQLAFVGTDHLNGALLRQAAAKLPETRIRFAGNVADVGPWYQAADVLVAPSRSEGCSNAILEAMACGLPVLASAVGGTPEVVCEGVNGWLVPPEDPRALAERLCDVLRDPAEAARRGCAAREHVAAGFCLRATAAAYRSLYDEIAPYNPP